MVYWQHILGYRNKHCAPHRSYIRLDVLVNASSRPHAAPSSKQHELWWNPLKMSHNARLNPTFPSPKATVSSSSLLEPWWSQHPQLSELSSASRIQLSWLNRRVSPFRHGWGSKVSWAGRPSNLPRWDVTLDWIDKTPAHVSVTTHSWQQDISSSILSKCRCSGAQLMYIALS